MTVAGPAVGRASNDFDVATVRRDFPALQQRVHGKPLAYLDSAATALKPRAVIDAVIGAYSRDCANVHRGVHLLSQRATEAYELAREKVARFVNAPGRTSIVLVRGTTEAINLLAATLGRTKLEAGDEVLVTELEHHSNIVPWQLICEHTGAKLAVARVNDAGEVSPETFEHALSDRTRIAAFAHVSNTLGTVLPVRELARLAHERGALVVVDGAQAAPHVPIDVTDLGVDCYAFSGHKVYGPSGVGALYVRPEILEAMPPYQSGGGMIRRVTFEGTTFQQGPERFEAGTPHIAGAIGLGAALDYLSAIDREALASHERRLLDHATGALLEVPGLRILGTANDKVAVISFTVDGVHPHDLGTIVDSEGVAVRTGHHCTQPLMDRFDVPATARASFGMYNVEAETEALVAAVRKAQRMFA